MQLRPYQQKIVDLVLDDVKNYIICLPTGAGKTVIARALIDELSKAYTVVFVVPRLELIKQAADEFGDPDIIWADKTCMTGKKVIVASKDSLRNKIDKLPENVILIFDEAHIGIEQTHSLVKKIPHVRVLGLTATPEREDGKALLKGDDAIHKFGVFDELLQKESVASLIDEGWLSKLRYYTKPIDGITDIKPDKADGQELSGEQMAELFDQNQLWGDIVSSYEEFGIKDGVKLPAIGFTSTIDMAEKVAGLFVEAGYDFRVISGEMSIKERRELINALAERRIDGLVNAALLTYGFDCPPVSYAFSCRHIKSRPLWFQIVGRILRLSEGKTEAIFVDHGDSVSEFEGLSCSLPILDPHIEWRVNGETREEKAERKKKQKKVQRQLKVIQAFDPLPCKMVEVSVEDTSERMLRCIEKLGKENGDLFNLVQGLQQTAISLRNKNNDLAAENAVLKKKIAASSPARYVDNAKTFDYCRKSYCSIRRTVHETMISQGKHDGSREHDLTVKKLREGARYLPFLIDEGCFQRSMSYWKEHYKY